MANGSNAVTRESSKLAFSLVASILIAVIALIIVSSQWFPPLINAFLIPAIAYGISVVVSIIHQYVTCKKVQMGMIFAGNSFVLLTNAGIGLLLFLEQVPFLRWIFGEYAPRNPITGLQYDPNSMEYADAMSNQNHYKIQLLSGIVKAVIPVYVSESVKEGIVYLYWSFWMTLLPLYFAIGVQSLC